MGSPLWLWTGSEWVKGLGDAEGRPAVRLYGSDPDGLAVAVSVDGDGKLQVAGAGGGEVVVADIQSIAAGAYLTIQPGADSSWKIVNLFWAYDVDIEFYDGTNTIVTATETGAGAWLNMALYIDNGHYLQVKNRHATDAKIIGYSGVDVT